MSESDNIKIQVTSQANTQGLDEAKKKVDALGASAKETSKDLDGLNTASEKAGKATAKTGRDMDDAAKGANNLTKDLRGLSGVASRLPGPLGQVSGMLGRVISLLRTPGGIWTAGVGLVTLAFIELHKRIQAVYTEADKQRVNNYAEALEHLVKKIDATKEAYDKLKKSREAAYDAQDKATDAEQSLEEARLETARQNALVEIDPNSEDAADINANFDARLAAVRHENALRKNQTEQERLQQDIDSKTARNEKLLGISADLKNRERALTSDASMSEQARAALKPKWYDYAKIANPFDLYGAAQSAVKTYNYHWGEGADYKKRAEGGYAAAQTARGTRTRLHAEIKDNAGELPLLQQQLSTSQTENRVIEERRRAEMQKFGNAQWHTTTTRERERDAMVEDALLRAGTDEWNTNRRAELQQQIETGDQGYYSQGRRMGELRDAEADTQTAYDQARAGLKKAESDPYRSAREKQRALEKWQSEVEKTRAAYDKAVSTGKRELPALKRATRSNYRQRPHPPSSASWRSVSTRTRIRSAA